MSFLEAVRAMGQRELGRSEDGPLSDVDSFTQMAMDLIEPEDEKAKRLPGMEIRVILDVSSSSTSCLEVLGIKEITLANYWAGDEDDRTKKRRYLYRDPVSPSATWRYTPLYKLGKGVADGRGAFLGEGNWKEDKGSRLYKLYNSTLLSFEKRGVFSEGSVDRIMDALVANVDRLAELWSDKKRSYILLFGLADGDRFLYPVDVPAFLEHFRGRLAEANTPKSKSGGKQSKKGASVMCGVCHQETDAPVNLDKVFAFANFDKKSFLPGLDSTDAAKAKVFPICQDCYRLLSEGRNIIDGKFLDAGSIYGVRIYTVPELVIGNDNLARVEQRTRDFLQQGLQQEKFLSKRVLENDDGLVYHFIFWEKNQAQERILLMVEDVPPSRLRKLQSLWGETVAAFDPFGRRFKEEQQAEDEAEDNDKVEGASLWQAVNVIRGTMLGLGGKNDADVNVLKDWILGLLGSLLRGEKVDVMRVKELIVSRLPGLCADADWPQKFSVSSARRWNAISDFLYRANGQ